MLPFTPMDQVSAYPCVWVLPTVSHPGQVEIRWTPKSLKEARLVPLSQVLGVIAAEKL